MIIPSILGSVLPFIFILSLLVFVHEWGHYIMARRYDIKVDAFSVGFGPEIFGWTDGQGTRWKVCWLPLGGYVNIDGDVLGRQRPLVKINVALAGPLANYILAWVMMWGLLVIGGLGTIPPVITKVHPGSLAETSGLQKGDRIIQVGTHTIQSFHHMTRALRAGSQGKTVDIAFVRHHKHHVVSVPVGKTLRPLGVEGRVVYKKSSILRGAGHAWREVYRIHSMTADAIIGMVFQKKSLDGLSGPLGIARMSSEAWAAGWHTVVLFMVGLSVSLGFMNILPLPLLDGGHVAFACIEWVWGRPLGAKVEKIIMTMGLVFMAGLFLFIMGKDLTRMGWVFGW